MGKIVEGMVDFQLKKRATKSEGRLPHISDLFCLQSSHDFERFNLLHGTYDTILSRLQYSKAVSSHR